MRRADLEHILRSASQIAEDPEVLVLGSQSILGSFTEEELPEAAHASVEADVAFWDDPGNDKSDAVDMHIGEDSQFHVTFGYYAQGVDVSVATLPAGWRDRIVSYRAENALPATGQCLDPHDLVVSKLVAGREKDYEFCSALLREGLVQLPTLRDRAAMLEVPLARRRVAGWLTAWPRRHA